MSDSAIPIKKVPPGTVRSVQGTSTILLAPICAVHTTAT
jgi:hypothetical protein